MIEEGETFEIAVYGTGAGGQDLVNVYQVMKTNAPTSTVEDWMDDLLEFFTAIYELVAAIQAAAIVWQKIRVRRTGEDGFVFGDAVFDPPIEGLGAGDVGAAGVCALLSLTTGVSRVTMRKYFGTLAESVINADGEITSTALSTVLGIGTLLLEPYVASTNEIQYGYLSPKVDGWVVPTAAIAWTEPAYQRRRRRGAGS